MNIKLFAFIGQPWRWWWWRVLAVIGAVVISLLIIRNASAAQESCFGFGSSNRVVNSQTWTRYLQLYVPSTASPLTAIYINVYTSDPASAGNINVQIVETTGGVPNDTIVAGSIVQVATNTLDVEPLGTSQAFDCRNLDELQRFEFAAPISLNVGQTYAISVHQTGVGNGGRFAHVTGFPSIAPLTGWKCTGTIPARCDTTEMALNEFPAASGVNWDIVYSIENATVDGSSQSGKIDGHIENLREYLKLDGANGGMLFGIAIVAMIFVVGLMRGIPFVVLALMNTIFMGIFARAEIVPPWILLAVVPVAGISLVLTLSTGRGSNEG